MYLPFPFPSFLRQQHTTQCTNMLHEGITKGEKNEESRTHTHTHQKIQAKKKKMGGRKGGG